MNVWTLWLTVLFSFVPALPYEVSITSIQNNQIIATYQQEEMKLELFNVDISDEGWQYLNERINEASKITIEFDPSSQIQSPYSVYLFADGSLLQEELIEKQLASIQIRNPEYTYESKMEEASHQQMVMASVDVKEETTRPLLAPLYLAVASICWMMIVVRWYQRRRHPAERK